MLYEAKEQHYSAGIQENVHDSKLLFRTVDKLLQRNIEKRYPSANGDQELANAIADFFSAKIVRIRDELLVKKRSRWGNALWRILSACHALASLKC